MHRRMTARRKKRFHASSLEELEGLRIPRVFGHLSVEEEHLSFDAQPVG
jgi:hypothetical protein